MGLHGNIAASNNLWNEEQDPPAGSVGSATPFFTFG